MRIKLGALIDDARGSIGNMVFSVSKHGIPYVRMKAAIASNPRSSSQQAFRCHTSRLSHYWINTLTPVERTSWEEFAQKNARRRVDRNQGGGARNLIPRGRGIMSGFNAFIGINQRIYMCSGQETEIKEEAPTGPPPYNVADFSVAWNAGTGKIDLSWNEVTLSSDFSNPLVRIWLESYAAGAHKQLVTCVTADTESASLEQAKYAFGVLADIDLHPGLYRLQCDVVNEDDTDASGGLVSPPSEILEVIVP